MKKDEITTIAEAKFYVQQRLGGIERDASNSHYRNKYATLEAVWNTIRPVLGEVGLVVTQSPGQIVDGNLEVVTTLQLVGDDPGREEIYRSWSPLQKLDAQGVGSNITYMCRYSLMAIFGLPPVDDDGVAASGRLLDEYEQMMGRIEKGVTITKEAVRGLYEKLGKAGLNNEAGQLVSAYKAANEKENANG